MNFIRLSALAGFCFFGAGSIAIAAPAPVLNCAPGSSASTVISVAANDIASLELTNEAGSSVGFYATLASNSTTGILEISGGARILGFPATTSKVVSDVMGPMTFLMLHSTNEPVSVTVVCNPGSKIGDALAQSVGTDATSLSMVRESSHRQLLDLVHQTLNFTRLLSSKSFDDEVAVIQNMTGSQASREAVLDDVFGYEIFINATMLGYYLDILKSLEPSDPKWHGANDAVVKQRARLTGIMDKLEQARTLNQQFAYSATTPQSAAVSAIDRAAGAANTVQNTFNLLGYGPTGGFEGNAVLGRGDNWIVTASAVGAISQGRIAGGDLNSLSGRGTLNIITNLAPGLGVGLGLGVGATSAKAGGLDDQSYQFAADFLVAYELSRFLSLTGGVGYELSAHNYTQAGATGSVSSHLFSADIGLSGRTNFAEFTLTPSFDVGFSHESQAAVTLTDGAIINGFERTGGKATVGAKFSQVHFILTGTGAYSVEPVVGLDANLSLAHVTPTGGASSTSVGLGAGVSAGVNLGFDGGLKASLMTRLSRSGETTGASVTGKLSASF